MTSYSRRGGPSPSLGLGTYRLAIGETSLLIHAIQRDCELIDTAPNYGEGQSQAAVGLAIRHKAAAFGAPAISTKVGFLPTRQSRTELIEYGILEAADAGVTHLLSPLYVRFQVNQNLLQLGCGTIDYLFLHNPENLLKISSISESLAVMQACFEECETLVEESKIRCYGVATWQELLDIAPVSHLVNIARAVAGEDHHFRALQLPVSLVHSEAAFDAIVLSQGPLVEAKRAGMTVFASSPLHGGELPRMITPEFGALFGDHVVPAHCALQYVRSIPFVDFVLVGPRSLAQFDDSLTLWQEPILSLDQLKRIALTVQ